MNQKKTYKPYRVLLLSLIVLVGICWLTTGNQVRRAASTGIFTENAEAIDSISTEHPASLLQIAYANPRFTIENAQSISTLDLEPLAIEGDSQPQTTSSARILVENAISTSTLNIEPPSRLIPVSTPASPTTTNDPPAPPSTLPTTETQQTAIDSGQPYVNLYGQVTDVTIGDEIILYLSVVNPITSPGDMMVQLTLEIPSGWSITSSEFGHGAGGLRTNMYPIEQGPNPRQIDIHILANEAYEGDVIGYMDYYFQGEEGKHHSEAKLPVTAGLSQPAGIEPIPVPVALTPWWWEPQWFVPVIIAVIACLVGIIRLLIRVTRGP